MAVEKVDSGDEQMNQRTPAPARRRVQYNIFSYLPQRTTVRQSRLEYRTERSNQEGNHRTAR